MRIIVDLDVPEGATHYCGLLTDEPLFLKMKLVGGGEHWFEYDPTREEWLLYSQQKPRWAKPLEFVK